MNLIKSLTGAVSRLSLIGRALMLPISLLPAAGLLLAFGDKFDLPLMMHAGGVIFDNLPLLFAIGSAVGLAGESGIAALSAAVSILIINTTIGTMLNITPEMAMSGGKYALVLGIPSLQMGVFGGLISGILAAYCYNKFHAIQLPEFLGFFLENVLFPSPQHYFLFCLVYYSLIFGGIFKMVSMPYLASSMVAIKHYPPSFLA